VEKGQSILILVNPLALFWAKVDVFLHHGRKYHIAWARSLLFLKEKVLDIAILD